MLHGDSRELDYGRSFDGLVTSPPYPGLIDYHEQHRTAYELLGLDDLRGLELGAGRSGDEPHSDRCLLRRHQQRARPSA